MALAVVNYPKLNEKDFQWIHSVSEKYEPYEFIIRCATVGDADFMDHAHLFLIPDEGFSKFVKLHDAFYRGLLEPKLRLDLPFVPHIGIASLPKPEAERVEAG
jgi:hypothetical protein